MICPNCQTETNSAERCPSCGIRLAPWRYAAAVSAKYYNRALRLAQERDLSGAIDDLRKSLSYNKKNIQARNLLGLVYFETGDISSALVQWVLSINIMPDKNLAGEYLAGYERNTRETVRLEKSIKLYNEALKAIHENNEDMAVISLKKALDLNPRFIEANNMLALCYIMDGKESLAVDVINAVLKQDINNEKAIGYYRELYPDKNRPVPKNYGSDPRNSAYYMPQMAVSRYNRRAVKPRPVLPVFFIGFICAAVIISLLAIPQILEIKDSEYKAEVSRYNELKHEFDELSAKYNDTAASLSRQQTRSDLPLQDRVKQINNAETLYKSDKATEAAMILVNLDTSDFTAEIMEQYNKEKQLILPLAAEQFYISGKQQAESGDTANAKTLFNQCLKCCSEGDEIRYSALYQLGKIAIDEGDEQTARNCYIEVAQRHPVQSVKNEAKRYLEEHNI